MNSFDLGLPNEYIVIHFAHKVMDSVRRSCHGFVHLSVDPFFNNERSMEQHRVLELEA